MEPGGLDPTTTLLVALLGTLGVIVSPALVALIARGGKAQAVAPPAPAIDIVADLDALNDRLERENDRLERENQRLRDQLEKERQQHAQDLARATGGAP